MKKILALLLITVLTLGTMVPGYAESDVLVEKVVFKDLSTTLKNLGLGGIRFYNEGVMIDSGEELSVGALRGETDLFIVNVSGTYGAEYYLPPYVVSTSRIQDGDYRDRPMWVAEQGAKTGELSVEFKEPKAVTDMEFIPQPSPRVTVTGITEPFVLEVHTTDGEIHKKTMVPIMDNNTVQTISLSDFITDEMILDIESDTYELNAGDTVDVNVLIKNVEDIYAEDFDVKYNTEAFELISSKVANTNQDKLYYKSEDTGQVRYIVASQGAINVINEDKALLTLTFKVKNYEGQADISVLKGLIANSQGDEYQVKCLGKTFTIIGRTLDVNGDEAFTLGDLAIASSLIGTESTAWGDFTPDFDLNGSVEEIDLNEIVAMILK